MRHDFGAFLRHGQDDGFFLSVGTGAVRGIRPRMSLKSSIPRYAALRSAFEDRLDDAIEENTKDLLNSLTPQDTVPTVTEADLLDLSAVKQDVLAEWQNRLAAIHAEYQSHPRRLRPLRAAMEERLVRAFAGLINQLRQQDLGVTRYIWRSRDDDKVRRAHAAYDDQEFRWDSPPEGGHPGQAHNCRCVAEPVRPNASEAALVDFVPSTGLPGAGLTAIAIEALPPAAIVAFAAGLGLAVGESAEQVAYALSHINDYAARRQIREAAEHLGLDISTVQGLLAAQAFAIGRTAAENSALTGVPKRGDRARIVAEAIGLYEMHRPGLFTLPTDNAFGVLNDARRLARQALAALDAGRLRPQDGALSDGWAEVFPELTDGERSLGELPGFLPERLDDLPETFTAEDLGLPGHTGHGRPEDPAGTVVSTPIPDETGPDIVEMPLPGQPTPVNPSDDAETQRGHQRENESAQVLQQSGHTVVQNPAVEGLKNPDYTIDGKVYDHYAPVTDSARNIWTAVKEKVEAGQAPNIVIGLQDSTVDENALRRQFADWPIDGLGDVIIVRGDGTVGKL